MIIDGWMCYFNLIIPCCLLQGYRTPVIPACPESFLERNNAIPDKPTVGALKHGNDKKLAFRYPVVLPRGDSLKDSSEGKGA